jgi:hypothetical protein
MFFFERDQMYKYVLSMSVLNQHLTDYSDETWPFEDTAFFFPSFDVTLGGVYRDIKNRIGTERGLEFPGNVIAIQIDAVEVQFRFTPFQDENAYLLSEIVVKKN